ncbi:hypothetical protein CEXT_31881 [Caerostris extrusa]|uniref:Uncharacterized protein n=1 Tax=Caerostris extrusa TaxID=172846 RepID=A0AAV4XR16_CAEEX|nr:hypothetical protein CEXT_31881 [Caerostris extrusa]
MAGGMKRSACTGTCLRRGGRYLTDDVRKGKSTVSNLFRRFFADQVNDFYEGWNPPGVELDLVGNVSEIFCEMSSAMVPLSRTCSDYS